VYYTVTPSDGELASAIFSQSAYITKAIGVTPLPLSKRPPFCPSFIEVDGAIKGADDMLLIVLTPPRFVIDAEAVDKEFGKELREDIEIVLAAKDKEEFLKQVSGNGMTFLSSALFIYSS
jgi:hypothetical protein